MRIYQNICYRVEDLFVRILAGKQSPQVVKEKVDKYRSEKEQLIQQRKNQMQKHEAR